MRTPILEEMKQHRLFFDGGTGSALQQQGLKRGESPELWNLTHPEVIRQLHYEYYRAGANIVKTNTFGANRLRFDRAVLQELIHAAVQNAKLARNRMEQEEGREDTARYIALDIGPSGKLLKPLGDLAFEDAVALFSEVAELGAAAGCDLILIETMNDSYETKAAVLAAKERTSLPVFVTNAYEESAKLLTGADPAAMAAMLEGLRADAIGINCGLDPAQILPIVKNLAKETSLPIVVNPNAGLPRAEHGKIVYAVNAEEFARLAREIVLAGVSIVGGCCGTTPEYIQKTVALCGALSPAKERKQKTTVVSSQTHAVKLGGRPILIGERLNPTGKSRMKQALREHALDYLLQEGISQEEKGADILDVNVGLPELDEPSVMEEVVRELQGVTDLPLQIDTSNREAMERALRIYNGKPLVNSVNGKQEVMEAVFPLVAKYGGVVVALTLDENGIPETAKGRIAIAKRIYQKAEEYGISKKDILIDPLAMAVSSDDRAALTALETLRYIHETEHGGTILGVSNVSFGLPLREVITSTFFIMAMQNGLSAAIINPNSTEMRRAYQCFCTLSGYDTSCSGYLSFAGSYEAELQRKYEKRTEPAALAEPIGTVGEQTLEYAVMHGLSAKAAQRTRELLKTTNPMEIIDKRLIPALDTVGRSFEKKICYLPQLLMSAEAAKSAFDIIRSDLRERGEVQEKKGVIILATVQGDIHDIGKNIVKAVLCNYGYEVIDLGKDVAPQVIVDACVERRAGLVGLSALMTTTVPAMAETIILLKKQAPWAKTVVGGAVLTPEYAKRLHADYYAKDAMETVAAAKEVYSEAMR